MKVTFTISKADFRNVISMQLNSNPSKRLKRYGLILLFIILVSLIFWLESKNLASVLVFDILVLIILRFAWGRYISSRYRNSNLHQPRTVELTQESIIAHVEGMQTSTEWEQVATINETNTFVIFVTKNAGSILVPNKAFKTPEERTRFVDTAKQNMSS